MTSSVVPIPPAYNEKGDLDLEETRKYLKYLESAGVDTVMTTAGTSQFNLLSLDEIFSLNQCCSKYFSGRVIMGLPGLSLNHLKKEVERYNELADSQRHLMFLYPDRFYNEESVTKYFHQAAEMWKGTSYIHGMFMRRGAGGQYDYTGAHLASISKHDLIVGVKEETSDLNNAFGVVRKLRSSAGKNFDIIVAGGSMRRFMLLQAAGANRFLAGIGNFYPKIEIDFLRACQSSNLLKAVSLIDNCETPVFNSFMKLGWHMCLREGLEITGIMKSGSRDPFPRFMAHQRGIVEHTLEQIKGQVTGDK